METLVTTGQRNRGRRYLRYAALVPCLIVAVFAVLVLNNNYSLRRLTRAEFMAATDKAIDTSTQWIVQHPDIQGNPSVMYMVGDMARMSRDPRLEQYLKSYINSSRVRIPGKPLTWYSVRMVDPQATVPVFNATAMPTSEILLDAYATAPDRVKLRPDQRAELFSTKKYWGSRNHQLLALTIYRFFNGPSPQLDELIKQVVEGVARDAYYDFRVSDSYEQRSAFILAAGRPDLVRSRWIDRILANQQPDGAWNYCWYGWCRGVFEFRSGEFAKGDQGHSTVQAAWALYQLKYQHADWIKEHYQ